MNENNRENHHNVQRETLLRDEDFFDKTTIPLTVSHKTAPSPLTAKRERALPGVRVLGERRQAAGVHVSPHVDVHRGVGLGQLSRQWDPLGGQRGDRGPGQRQP